MESIRHRVSTLIVVLGMLIAVTACGTSDPTAVPAATEAPAATEPASQAPTAEEQAVEASGDKVLKLGILIPLSGYTARTGEEMKAAVEMAMEEANYEIGPYRVEMVWIDSQGDPGKAAQAYEQAIVQKDIDAAMLNWHSSISVACMELSAKHKVPHFFGFGATEVVNEKYASDPEKYSYWMGKTWPSPAKLTIAYVTALEDAIAAGQWSPEAKKVYYLGEDSDWGRSYTKALKEQFGAAGWEMLGEDYFTRGQTEFFPLLSKVQQKGPALVTMVADGTETMAAYAKQAKELGLSDEALMILDGLGWVGEWYELTGDASDYILDLIPEFGSAESQAWAIAFEEKYGLEPSAAAAGQTYDMIRFFLKVANRALEKHGEITSETLYEVGQTELWQGTLVYDEGLIHPLYKYTPETIPDLMVGDGYFMFPVRQYYGGASEIVWPDEWATSGLRAPK